MVSASELNRVSTHMYHGDKSVVDLGRTVLFR